MSRPFSIPFDVGPPWEHPSRWFWAWLRVYVAAALIAAAIFLAAAATYAAYYHVPAEVPTQALPDHVTRPVPLIQPATPPVDKNEALISGIDKKLIGIPVYLDMTPIGVVQKVFRDSKGKLSAVILELKTKNPDTATETLELPASAIDWRAPADPTVIFSNAMTPDQADASEQKLWGVILDPSLFRSAPRHPK